MIFGLSGEYSTSQNNNNHQFNGIITKKIHKEIDKLTSIYFGDGEQERTGNGQIVGTNVGNKAYWQLGMLMSIIDYIWNILRSAQVQVISISILSVQFN